jgi:hypothetical protein
LKPKTYSTVFPEETTLRRGIVNVSPTGFGDGQPLCGLLNEIYKITGTVESGFRW